MRDVSETDLCMESLVELELEVEEKGNKIFITPTTTRNRDTDLKMVKLRML